MYEVMPTCALGGRREPESALPCVPYGTQGRKGVNPLAPTILDEQMLKIDLESLTDDCGSYSTKK